MGEEIQGLDPGLLKLGKIQGLDPPLLPTVNTNSGVIHYDLSYEHSQFMLIDYCKNIISFNVNRNLRPLLSYLSLYFFWHLDWPLGEVGFGGGGGEAGRGLAGRTHPLCRWVGHRRFENATFCRVFLSGVKKTHSDHYCL